MDTYISNVGVDILNFNLQGFKRVYYWRNLYKESEYA